MREFWGGGRGGRKWNRLVLLEEVGLRVFVGAFS